MQSVRVAPLRNCWASLANTPKVTSCITFIDVNVSLNIACFDANAPVAFCIQADLSAVVLGSEAPR